MIAFHGVIRQGELFCRSLIVGIRRAGSTVAEIVMLLQERGDKIRPVAVRNLGLPVRDLGMTAQLAQKIQKAGERFWFLEEVPILFKKQLDTFRDGKGEFDYV